MSEFPALTAAAVTVAAAAAEVEAANILVAIKQCQIVATVVACAQPLFILYIYTVYNFLSWSKLKH